MKTKFKQLLIAMFTLAFLAILPAAVKADPITLTLDTTHSVAQGSSVTYFGSLSNGGVPGRFINAVSITLPTGLTFNDSAFFTNVPAVLAPGATTGIVSFFDVIADLLIPPGSYTGSFSVLGGDDDQDQNLLATQEFTIVVTPGGQPAIPEPASMLLLASGLAGAAALKRRKRSQSPAP